MKRKACNYEGCLYLSEGKGMLSSIFERIRDNVYMWSDNELKH